MAKTTGIYKLTAPNGRVYIGKGRPIEYRWLAYGKIEKSDNRQRKLFNSINKYGWNNFKKEIIHSLPSDVSEVDLVKWENYYISLFDTVRNGLNCCGGEVHIVCDETKEKHRANMMGNSFRRGCVTSDAQKKMIRERHTGKVLSAEIRANISKGLTGLKRPRSAKHQEKITAAITGVKKSAKARERMTVANRLRAKTRPETFLRGGSNGFAKLTADQIIEIKSKFIPEIYGGRRLAKEYNISPSQCYRIIKGQTWSHVQCKMTPITDNLNAEIAIKRKDRTLSRLGLKWCHETKNKFKETIARRKALHHTV